MIGDLGLNISQFHFSSHSCLNRIMYPIKLNQIPTNTDAKVASNIPPTISKKAAKTVDQPNITFDLLFMYVRPIFYLFSDRLGVIPKLIRLVVGSLINVAMVTSVLIPTLGDPKMHDHR